MNANQPEKLHHPFAKVVTGVDTTAKLHTPSYPTRKVEVTNEGKKLVVYTTSESVVATDTNGGWRHVAKHCAESCRLPFN